MSEISERYRKAAAAFSDRANSVPAEAWDNPAPCDGWAARDIVRHMVEWMPGMLRECAGIDVPIGPTADEDPAAAWAVMDRCIQASLDDPGVAQREFSHAKMGTMPLESAVDSFFTADVFVHTWDLARATGLDETLDPDEVHRMFSGMEQYDEMLRSSGQYGPRVPVPDEADEQTRFIAFMGREP